MKRPTAQENDKNEDSVVEHQHPEDWASSEHAELVETLRSELPFIERVIISPSEPSPDGLILAVLLSKDAPKKTSYTHQILSICERLETFVYPAVFTWRQWHGLDDRAFNRDWTEFFEDLGHHLPSIELIRRHGEQPRDLRRFALKELKAYRKTIFHLRSYTSVPMHLRLSLCTDVYRRALDLLFAIHGKRFTSTHESMKTFTDVFVDGGSYEQGHLLSYFEMVALATQGGLLHQLSSDRTLRKPALHLFDSALSFLDVFRRDLLNKFSTPGERRRRLLFKSVGLGLAGCAIVAGIALSYFLTRPEEPIADESVITRPGGLLGHYYKGKNFQKLLLKKIDGRINFRTRKSWGKALPRDHFSVRWTGYIHFPDDTSKLLCVRIDDGAKIHFNNRLIVDDWKVAGARLRCGRVRPKKGWYPLKIEYFDTVGWAECRLRWGKERDKAVVVPGKNLCCR